MRKIVSVLLVLCLSLCLVSCGKMDMKKIYDANSLEKIFKDNSSFSLTTTVVETGESYMSYHEPNMTYIEKDGKSSVYLSTGCYSYSDEKYYIEIFTNEDYSVHILRDIFTSPVVGQSAKVSTVVSSDTTDDVVVVTTKPSKPYNEELCREFGLEGANFELVYRLEKNGNKFISLEFNADGKNIANTTIEYNTTRPELATVLYDKLNAPATDCRTVKVVLDPNTSYTRTIIAHPVKGDSFKIDPPEGYKSVFGNHQCTKPYQSKGADQDAVMYLTKGQ